MVTMTIEDLERQLAGLQDQHTATLAAVEQAATELAPLERALEEARAVYNAAGTALQAAQRAYAGPRHDPYETHREQSPAEHEQARSDAKDAAVLFDQADRELGAALVVRNTADARRGDLQMLGYRLEAAIAETERDLERARHAPAPERDLLARIRARVLGGAA